MRRFFSAIFVVTSFLVAVALNPAAAPALPASPASSGPVGEADFIPGGNSQARLSPEPCPGFVEDRFNSCYSGVATGDWGSGPVVPTKCYMDTKFIIRSQVNSQIVTVKVIGSNARFQGPDAPTKGRFKFELSLKDPISPTPLRVKTIQPIEIKYEDASVGPVTVERSVSPDLATSADQKYELRLKTSVKADLPEGVWGPPTLEKNLQLGLRCDQDKPGDDNLFRFRYGPESKGCVNAGYWPTVVFPLDSYPYIGDNVLSAQAAGSPGAPGAPGETVPLHRAVGTQVNANRNASCQNPSRVFAEIGERPLPTAEVSAWECDEYPFASAIEGGALARMKWVPAAENSGSQGTVLREFYVNYRVLANDPFLVGTVTCDVC